MIGLSIFTNKIQADFNFQILEIRQEVQRVLFARPEYSHLETCGGGGVLHANKETVTQVKALTKVNLPWPAYAQDKSKVGCALYSFTLRALYVR